MLISNTILNNRLRLLIVGSGSYSDVTDKNYTSIANELVGRGHKVLYLNWASPNSLKYGKVVPKFDFAQIKYNFRKLSSRTVGLIRDFHPNIVEIITPRYRNIVVGSDIHEITEAPLVLHQADDYSYELERFLASASLKQKIKFIIGNTIIKRLWPAKWFLYDEAAYLKNVGKISAMDCMPPEKLIERIKETACKYKEDIIVEMVHHIVVDYSVLQEYVDPGKYTKDRPVTKFVFAGYITAYNISEIEILLRAIGLCIEADHNNVELILVGKIHKNAIKKLQKVIDGLSINAHVTHKGYIAKDSEFYKLISSCDIAVIPGHNSSANSCRFPSKVVPFICLGIPVILSCAYDFSQQLSDSEVIKTKTDDPAELANKMIMLIDNRTMCHTISEKIREKARKLFRPAAEVADDFERFYMNVLSKKSKQNTLL